MPIDKPQKVRTTALCFIPPLTSQQAIQTLRHQYDRQIDRWPPHVNVLYPFVPVDQFPDAAKRLCVCLRAMHPFQIQISKLDFFDHGKRNLTAWLAPDETGTAGGSESWRQVQTFCQEAFPHCTEATDRGTFTPHMTVGQFRDQARLEAVQQEVHRTFAANPLKVTVSELCLISRDGQDAPFLIHWRIPFGPRDTLQDLAEESPLCRGVWLPPQQVQTATVVSAAKVLVTLASNTNRSVRTAAVVAGKADKRQLGKVAKNKLRLSGSARRFIFFRDSGEQVHEGELIAKDSLIIVSRGEAFVGVVVPALPDTIGEADGQGAGDQRGSETQSGRVEGVLALTVCSEPGYDRTWITRDTMLDKQLPRRNVSQGIRLLSWNLLAGCLAQGNRDAVGSPQSSSSSAAAAAASVSPLECGVHPRAVCTTGVTSEDIDNDIQKKHGKRNKKPAKRKKNWRRKQKDHHVFACAHEHLLWSHRAPLVARELLAHRPDMLCLQEVDTLQLGWLRQLLAPKGFVGVASAESDERRGCKDMYGCAIFWQTSKLVAVGGPTVAVLPGGAHVLLMQRFAFAVHEAGGGTGSTGGGTNSLTGTERVEGGSTFVVATTHLKAGISAQFEGRRKKQAFVAVEYLNAFRRTRPSSSSSSSSSPPAASSSPGETEPVILTGDFNAHHSDVRSDNDGKFLDPRAVSLLLRAGLRCAYQEALGESPIFTYLAGWKNRVVKMAFDHILLLGQGVRAVRALQVPTEAAITRSAPFCLLPNANYPSDHLSLLTDLDFRSEGGGGGGDCGSSETGGATGAGHDDGGGGGGGPGGGPGAGSDDGGGGGGGGAGTAGLSGAADGGGDACSFGHTDVPIEAQVIPAGFYRCDHRQRPSHLTLYYQRCADTTTISLGVVLDGSQFTPIWKSGETSFKLVQSNGTSVAYSFDPNQRCIVPYLSQKQKRKQEKRRRGKKDSDRCNNGAKVFALVGRWPIPALHDPSNGIAQVCLDVYERGYAVLKNVFPRHARRAKLFSAITDELWTDKNGGNSFGWYSTHKEYAEQEARSGEERGSTADITTDTDRGRELIASLLAPAVPFLDAMLGEGRWEHTGRLQLGCATATKASACLPNYHIDQMFLNKGEPFSLLLGVPLAGQLHLPLAGNMAVFAGSHRRIRECLLAAPPSLLHSPDVHKAVKLSTVYGVPDHSPSAIKAVVGDAYIVHYRTIHGVLPNLQDDRAIAYVRVRVRNSCMQPVIPTTTTTPPTSETNWIGSVIAHGPWERFSTYMQSLGQTTAGATNTGGVKHTE